MTTSKEAKIGIRATLTVLGIWLLLILALLTISVETISLTDFTLEGILIFSLVIASGLFWGARAGKQIIRDNKNDDLIGIKTAFAILLSFYLPAYFLSVNFLGMAEHTYTLTNAVKGFLTYFLIYSIPTLITGIIIGRTIKKLGQK